jgi:hypothetical protein
MLYVLLIHIDMDQFEITISMVNYLLYVIIIMLIYGIKIIRKMPIILTREPYFPPIPSNPIFSLRIRGMCVFLFQYAKLY